MERTLLFVYNADSGIMNGLRDMVHKITSPETYPCSLCAVSYGTLGMHKRWRQFLNNLPIPYELLHRDELQQQYGIINMPLPAMLLRENNTTHILADAEAMNACKTLDDLMDLTVNRLATTMPEASESLFEKQIV